MKTKRFLSLLLCAVLILSMMPGAALAASNPDNLIFDVSEGSIIIEAGTESGTIKVTYGAAQSKDNIQDAEEITIIGTTTSNSVTVETGVTANITLDGVSIESSGCAFELQGTAVVILTLAEGADNILRSGESNAGLQVPENAALTIGGSGMLTAEAGYGAGIGGGISGGDGDAGGTVTINGGTVTASSTYGAGIGGGGFFLYGMSGSGGTVTINGGTVTASSVLGAGIGGGGGYVTGGAGGTVTITGGSVTANSDRGAGIGGGVATVGIGGAGGTVTITGGTVRASSADGAGIGGGFSYHTGGAGGNVEINGGTVTTTSKWGAGIGGGFSYYTGGAGGNLDITGGTVDVTSEQGAGIGGGCGLMGGSGVLVGSAGTTVINGGSANASGNVSSIQDTPTNGPVNGNHTVSMDAVTIQGVSSVTEVLGLTIPGASYYGTNDLYTDGDGKLYLWLPSGAVMQQVRTGDTIYNWNATSSTLEADTTPPTVTGVTPSGTGASISGSLNVTFSEEMGTVTGTISLDGGTALTGGNWNAEKTIYTVPYSGLAYGREYTVSISGFEDYSGNVMDPDPDTSYSFTTVARSSGGGSSSAHKPLTYSAAITEGGALNVAVDMASGFASVTVSDALGASMQNGRNATITMPSIPGVTSYTLGIPVAYLSTPGGGTLTFNTHTGSMTLPADMLEGIEGAEGKRAGITIGLGDKSGLSDAEKAAIGDRPLIEISLTLDGVQTHWNHPGAPVTISIPYIPTPAELLNPEAIVIWYIDGSGNPISVPNGHYDPVTGMVTFSTTHFSYFAVAYHPASFNDVSEGAWYFKPINYIAARGITNGTGGENFSPDAKLSRGEFIVLLMRAYGIAPDANPEDNFSDAGNSYYTGYLAAAKRLNISAGVGNDLFAPRREITRQEMFNLLYNALKVIDQLPQGDSGKTLTDFTDTGKIDNWAKDAMTLLVKTGTAGGSNGALNPTAATTRAEMAQVLYNLLGK